MKRNWNIGHHFKIGGFVTINPGVTQNSFVEIFTYTMIGSRTAGKDHINIEKNLIIGVESTEIQDIPENSFAYGKPCILHKANYVNEVNRKETLFLRTYL